MEDLLKKLKQASDLSSKAYSAYKEAKEIEDKLRQDVREQMLSTGLLSAKTKDLTASIVNKPTIEIKHEQSAVEWLKNEPNLETDQFIGLKATEFKKFALHRLKETGEEIPGTIIIMNQSLSIRSK